MEHHKLEEELFAAVLNLPADERESYLARACQDSPSLQARLHSLIRAVDSTISTRSRVFMTRPEQSGDQIDNYRLVQEIGEGGCGVVYLAEQVAPVRRNVALKIIRLGMDTKDVMTRFEAERQILALMEHPNIAKVFDAGATASGRPYFVMELVRGIRITDYCNQLRLTVRERVELFIQVCLAIQHAHSKGIIHRDIKPSNVLVTLVDGAPIAKVIDFGIAKATQGRLTEETLLTAMEQFVGTPAYVSPEQTELGGTNVDTRSDVYSLGVLLYELLTDCRPFDSERTSLSEFDNLRQRIRTERPLRPSRQIATHGRLAEIATLYQVSPSRLVQDVRGDLDWIALKCLEKEQHYRYQTAHELCSDLRRHLNQEAVMARRHHATDAAVKLVRRHRMLVRMSAFIVGVLLIETMLTASLTRDASRASRSAQEFNGVLQYAVVTQAMSRPPLDAGGSWYSPLQPPSERGLAYEPLTRASIHQTIASGYRGLGDTEKERLHYEKALAIYLNQRDGGWVSRRLSAWRMLTIHYLGSTPAELEARRVAATKHLAMSTSQSFVYYKLGRLTEARALLEPALRLGESLSATHDDERRVLLELRAILAAVYSAEGDDAAAERLASTVLKGRRELVGNREEDKESLYLLAEVHANAGRFALAERELLEATAYETAARGPQQTTCSCRVQPGPGNEPMRPLWAEGMLVEAGFDLANSLRPWASSCSCKARQRGQRPMESTRDRS